MPVELDLSEQPEAVQEAGALAQGEVPALKALGGFVGENIDPRKWTPEQQTQMSLMMGLSSGPELRVLGGMHPQLSANEPGGIGGMMMPRSPVPATKNFQIPEWSPDSKDGFKRLPRTMGTRGGIGTRPQNANNSEKDRLWEYQAGAINLLNNRQFQDHLADLNVPFVEGITNGLTSKQMMFTARNVSAMTGDSLEDSYRKLTEIIEGMVHAQSPIPLKTLFRRALMNERGMSLAE